MNGALALAVSLGIVASFDDLRRRHIANWITAGGFAASVLYHAVTGGWMGLAQSLEGAAAGFGVLLVFVVLGGMGTGDLKLSTAFGALLGPKGILLAALLTAPLGGLMAGLMLAFRWRTRAIPYAPAIAIGAWLALLGQK